MDRRLNPDRVERPIAKVSTEQKRLWDALNDYITQHGGWVVSVPHHRELRVELPRDSALASKLMEFGYGVFAAATSTRTTSKGLEVVDVISFALPGK
jgi:hypothetical protein